ncbi:uncharacterized protein ARMOST_09975 [Armillaria ostoyae]|uniref:Uncharacterized protein n=1 Tax=Armillaria ostoyae TaxID=47428 RepID=A0A284RCZ9_ARMOS|nr:uncharacterized protein ARMOST_09975 [Armillaria ostoyae]
MTHLEIKVLRIRIRSRRKLPNGLRESHCSRSETVSAICMMVKANTVLFFGPVAESFGDLTNPVLQASGTGIQFTLCLLGTGSSNSLTRNDIVPCIQRASFDLLNQYLGEIHIALGKMSQTNS